MRPSSSNSCQALATDDWLGMVSMRIQRPSTRSVLTTLNDCEPPLTCITARVLPWVGRTLPSSSGSQSIWFLNTPVIVPWRSGDTQTWPSDHCDHSRSCRTLGCCLSTLSSMGRSCGSNTRVSAPRYCRMRSASRASLRLYDCGRSEPYRMRMRGRRASPWPSASGGAGGGSRRVSRCAGRSKGDCPDSFILLF